jgi:hypothetical protein
MGWNTGCKLFPLITGDKIMELAIDHDVGFLVLISVEIIMRIF